MRALTWQIVIVLALAAMLVGCQPEKRSEATASGPTGEQPTGVGREPLDACAMRLHDIEGMLLQYYMLHKRVPASLSELAPLADTGQTLEVTCPASRKPYLYDPDGFQVPPRDKPYQWSLPGYVVVCCPEPSHHQMKVTGGRIDGVRWGIAVQPGDGPLVTRVVGIPEDDFKRRTK